MKQSASYRLAPSEEVADAYVASQGITPAPFGWPTVMGWIGKEPIGLLGTIKKPDVILAGPLVVTRKHNNGPTILRLIDAYEVVLRLAKVTSYMFSVEEDNSFGEMITRLSGDKPYTIVDGLLWFNRRLQ